MEAAAVLGVIGSIVSIVDFSSKVVERLREYSSKTHEIPESFQDILTRLPLFVTILKKVELQARNGRVGDDAANALQPVLDSSLKRARWLDEKLRRVLPTTKSSSLDKGILALKSLALEDKVQSRLAKLQDNISLLVFHQATNNVDISEAILQKLSKLTISSAKTSQITAQYSRGVNLGAAPQIQLDAFIGRDSELTQLSQWLTPKSDPPLQKVVSVVGMGGLGKTQLSIHFAKKHGHRYSSIFWANAKDEKTLKQSLYDIWKIVTEHEQRSSDSNIDDVDRRVRELQEWFSEEGNYQWLLILDNYDDPLIPGISSATGYDIRPYFPRRSHGNILITTRSTQLSFTKQLRLKKLESIEQGLAILHTRSGRDVQMDPDARRLVLRLDGLPLALATAGLYLSHTPDSCAAYLEAYDQKWSELEEHSGTLVDYKDRTLFSTWNLSLQRVRAQDPDAAELMAFFAYLDNQNIWFELLEAGADYPLPWLSRVTESKLRFQQAMARLHDYCLIEISNGFYGLHSCVHDWTLRGLNHDINREYLMVAKHCIAGNTVDIYQQYHHQQYHHQQDHRTFDRRLLNHLTRINHEVFEDINEPALYNSMDLKDYSKIGTIWALIGDLDTSVRVLRPALTILQDSSDPDEKLMFVIMLSLGLLYDASGRHQCAISMFKQILARHSQIFGWDSTQVMIVSTILADSYCKVGKEVQAEGMLRRVLKSSREEETEIKARAAGYLAYLYHQQGRVAKARHYYKMALNYDNGSLAPDHSTILMTLVKFGRLYQDERKLDRAEELYQRALTRFEDTVGPADIRTLEVVFHLGDLYMDKRDLDRAEQMFQRLKEGIEWWPSFEKTTQGVIDELETIAQMRSELQRKQQPICGKMASSRSASSREGRKFRGYSWWRNILSPSRHWY